MSFHPHEAQDRAGVSEVWYLMPSANPENAARCVPEWRRMGYRVGVLEDRTPIDVACDAKLTRSRYPGWAASINALFREVVPSSCQVIVGGGDDLFPDPSLRAEAIAEQFLERFPDTMGVMQPTGDGFEATASICGSPWIGRAWMSRMYGGAGGLCEAYAQQYADEELYWVARCAGRLQLRPDLTQRHEHFRRAGRAAPTYWIESAAANEAGDCKAFIERSGVGFPGAAPEDDPGMLDTSVFDKAYDGRAHERYRTVLAPGAAHDRAAALLGEALRGLAAEGVRCVVIYGAGQHTHRASAAFAQSPVRIGAILDDDPARSGGIIGGIRVMTPEQLVGAGIEPDAVVLSSDTFEAQLRERARVFEQRGIRVEPLYDEMHTSVNAR